LEDGRLLLEEGDEEEDGGCENDCSQNEVLLASTACSSEDSEEREMTIA
jgi:hypothetical protein